MSYVTTSSRSTTSGPQASQTAGAGVTHTADEYSRIGPSYTYVTTQVNSRRQQPATVVAVGRKRESRLSERYEFSEAHPTAAGGGDDSGHDGVQADMGVNRGQEHDEYSRLQY